MSSVAVVQSKLKHMFKYMKNQANTHTPWEEIITKLFLVVVSLVGDRLWTPQDDLTSLFAEDGMGFLAILLQV